jgi:hypothetical protein
MIGNRTLADAILDCLIHSALERGLHCSIDRLAGALQSSLHTSTLRRMTFFIHGSRSGSSKQMKENTINCEVNGAYYGCDCGSYASAKAFLRTSWPPL